jgi:hypothetical protein
LPDARELIPGFVPENDLERAVTEDPELLAGLAWGKPRKGHPEGTVGAHVGDLLGTIERDDHTGEPRSQLRFIALVHDAFKYRVHEWLPKTGENHHAMRARRFAQRFTDDEQLLATIQYHDGPYAIWRKMKRRGSLDERLFDEMMRQVPDAELFLRFIELDGSTEGKNPEPIRWFREELERRGLIRRSVRPPP